MKAPYDPINVHEEFPVADWHKSFASDPDGTGCVEVNFGLLDSKGLIGLRDSTQPDAGGMVYDKAEWSAFLAGAKNGQFDI